MTITIELPEELSARLAAAGIPAEDASDYAIAVLAEAADCAEVRSWWDCLSERLSQKSYRACAHPS